VPGRDFPLEGANVLVADVRNAVAGDTHQGRPLRSKQGIEVGHVFKLGTKYSEKLHAYYLDENSAEHPCLMGCYGIGVNRILASAIETGHDANGIIWPISIAPFEAIITTVSQEDEQVAAAGARLYQELRDQGVDVLYDDRAARGGVKFKDADLIGIPVRITIGQKGLQEGKLEVKTRRGDVNESVPLEQTAARVVELVRQLYQELDEN
jgi:prolyl-tRNA synthetase